MKRIIFALLICFGLGSVFLPCVDGNAGEPPKIDLMTRLNGLPKDFAARTSAISDLTALCQSYPHLCRDVGVKNGQLFLEIAGGSLVIYDDGQTKSLEQKMASPDIEDMFSLVYPVGFMETPLDPDFDPGRVRVYQVFNTLYGKTADSIRGRLVKINFCGKQVMFHGSEGASEALNAVSATLSDLLKKNPALNKYILPLGGTFNYREIAGTDRLSPHSYGIAIDLNPDKGAYWRSKPKTLPAELAKMRRDYPSEIVNAFESHGFIWGGKWGHYDLMHFEYRPEMIRKTKMILESQKGPSH